MLILIHIQDQPLKEPHRLDHRIRLDALIDRVHAGHFVGAEFDVAEAVDVFGEGPVAAGVGVTVGLRR